MEQATAIQPSPITAILENIMEKGEIARQIHSARTEVLKYHVQADFAMRSAKDAGPALKLYAEAEVRHRGLIDAYALLVARESLAQSNRGK